MADVAVETPEVVVAETTEEEAIVATKEVAKEVAKEVTKEVTKEVVEKDVSDLKEVITTPEDKEDIPKDNGDVIKDDVVEHKNGDEKEALPKENGESNGTAKDADVVEIKRKNGEETDPVESIVEGVSPEKKLKLAEDKSESNEENVVEANGEATEVSS